MLVSCGPAWIERRLGEVYAIHSSLVEESKRIHAQWWPYLCEREPFLLKHVKQGARVDRERLKALLRMECWQP